MPTECGAARQDGVNPPERCKAFLGHGGGHVYERVVEVTALDDTEPKHMVVPSGRVPPRLLNWPSGQPLPGYMQPEGTLWNLMANAMDNLDGTEGTVDECIDKLMIAAAPHLEALVEGDVRAD